MNHNTIASNFNRRIQLSAFGALLVLLAGLLLVTQPVRADTYEVTNTNDNGSGSLRQAITDANNRAGTDTITFAAATNGIPIVLAGSASEDINASGDLDILNSGDLTIQGNGAANTIIDGGVIDRIFHVCPAGGCTNIVTLSGVSIRNGHPGIASGGGILNNGATLNVQNSTIGGVGTGNQAWTGGGIHNEAGSATVDGCIISANAALGGGGIYNKATLTVRNSTLIGGIGAGNQAQDGGGIYNNTGTTTIDGSTISANTATEHGGGIYNQAALTIRNGSLIGGMGASNSAALGGGLYNETGTTMVDGSTISANTATDGGGIHNLAMLTVQNGSTIGGVGAGNSAGNVGGGILNALSGTVSVTNSSVSANTATSLGGGIFNLNTLNVQNGSTIGGVGIGNTAAYGGGIYNSIGTTTIVNSTVNFNTGTDGGGILNGVDGELTVDASDVSANTASNDGGGIYNTATLNVLNGSTLSANTATTHAGGGIYNDSGGTTTVISSTLSANLAPDWDGGGIYNLSGGAVTLDRSLIIDNIGEDYGGGIYNNGTLNVENGSAVDGNTTLVGYGGGIYNNDSGTVTVNSSSVSDNSSDNYGGGIYNNGTLNVENGSTIDGNTADGDGGGILNESEGIVTINSSSVSANTATDGSGGGILNENTLNILIGSTVSANTAHRYGGGIYTSDTLNILNGNTVSANTAYMDGGGIFVYGDLTVDGSTLSANTATDGGGIYSNGSTTVTGSRILYNTATTNGGGVYNDNGTAGETSVTSSCIVGNSDVSFFNTRSAQQIATGNWWGAATGPNSPGADTTSGIVDTSGFLTAPILGCAPDLRVAKANDVGGNGVVGAPFHWTLTVSNNGLTNGTFNAGQLILQDNLPVGPTYGTPLVGNFMGVTNSANIYCSLAGNTLSCAAAGANVTLGTVGGSFDVTVSVIPSAPGTLVNPASGGNCWVDPDGNVTEGDESNNNCSANIVNVVVSTIFQYLPLVLK